MGQKGVFCKGLKFIIRLTAITRIKLSEHGEAKRHGVLSIMILTHQNHIKIKLIFIAIGLAFLFPMLSEAQTQVSFQWDPNIETDFVEGYRVFHRIEGDAYNYPNPAWEGSETSCTIEIADDEGRHYFVARAFDTEGFESQDSDEVCLGCSIDTGDNCPNDPNKVEPGICGCGIPDIDTDGDGSLDCKDNCPDDSDKIEPGVSGCGFPEPIDDDPPEDIDNCPNDPNKVYPGICGCGIPDIDTDGDGSLDCNDRCPDDPSKVYPGVCGCGIPDIDTDGDGSPDCNDRCPDDPDKIEPGVYGCGFPESNNDESPEDNDNCPNDPDKTEPGICGCGIVDIDMDDDGVWDCYDTDDDNDGIGDIAENNGPNQGDANRDGILDSLQCNVGSIKMSNNKNYISMESPEGTCISDFKRVGTLSTDEFPQDIDFIYGVYAYTIQDTGYGKSVVVTITLPQGVSPDTFYIYGQTSENRTDHWYEFLDNGQTGAEINGNRITLFLTDARRGDSVLTKDRKVISLGGIGFISDGTERAYNTDSSSSSGGNACFLDCLSQ